MGHRLIRTLLVGGLLVVLGVVGTAADLDDGTPTTADAPTPATTTAPPLRSPALGTYTAPVNAGGIEGVTQFGSSVGASVTMALAYIDVRDTWATLASPRWLLDPWALWLKQDTSRQLVLSVPMLLSRSAGRFHDPSLDQYFVKLAQAIKSRGIADQTIIRLGWEMTGDWNPYGRRYDADGSGFRAMWNRVVPKMKAVHPFKFSWCVTLGGPISPAIYYPGDHLVDIIAFDRYDNWVTSPDLAPQARWDSMLTEPHGLDWIRTFAASKGKPLAIDEWGLWNAENSPAGSRGGGDNPTFVTNMLAWARQHDVLYAIYYNASTGGVGTTLQQNPDSLQAFRGAIAAQRAGS